VLGWGMTYVGVLASQLALEWAGGALLGLWCLLAAALAALTLGSLAGLLVGPLLEPPDRRGGGWVLLVVALALTGAAWIGRPALPPAGFWGAVPHLLATRAWWLLVLLAVAGLTLLPRLTLREGEPFEHGRLRRALAFWLAASLPPLAALVLIGPGPLWLEYWFLALILPHGLLLGTLGVRLPEASLPRRGVRARLVGVSWTGTVLLLCGGFMREMVG